MKLKILTAMILFLSLSLVSCHQQHTETILQDNPVEERVVITLWDYLIEGSDTSDVIAAYETIHPHIHINRQYIPFSDIKKKLVYAAALGEMPDIILIDDPFFQTLAAMDVLFDLTEAVMEWHNPQDIFADIPLNSCTYNGDIFGLPMGVHNLALFYNQDMLENANLQPPETWDELLLAAEKLTTEDVAGFKLTAVKNQQSIYTFLPFLWQTGSDLETLNDGGTLEALQFWKTMIDHGYMPQDILRDNSQTVMVQFSQGKVAMMVNSSWQVKLLKNFPHLRWGVGKLPGHHYDATSLGSENWAITATSSHKEAAWNFLKFTQEKENLVPLLLRTGRLPAQTKLLDEPEWQADEHLKVFIDSLDFSRLGDYGVNYPEISVYLQDMLHQSLSGNQPVEEAVDEAYAKIRPLL
ncbi:sugar ABC transporter substrate-binding protein [Anoxynatronum buryatiense]|uniref:Carbohydrate ABC transporter substrate-binding protein, CUT1 family n=1 Tax=Anoxynatronum buryatiense TaxID=489973 RepID=A0AA45WYW1_9CLOT|nr:sugar ABC transporter substrate-binding protein [Anoxynatronum buryatiense]SMP65284.1 carbohydrate ABC transporter substrate-binding protein, CUT1 family [Anoxynatronum buryatiense]